jgi:hypothetical protein
MDFINMIEKKISADGESYYFNTETTEKYGEIVGGLAWPEAKEGFLVIAAVDFFEDKELGARHIRVLEEVTESDNDTFLRHALELQKHFSPFMGAIRFYGDTTSPSMMEFLDQFNRDRRNRGLDPFYLTEAPQLKGHQKLEFYTQLIRKYTQSGGKILHFCDTALPSYIMGLSPEGIIKNVLDHPPIAALGYALAVLTTWKPWRKEIEVKARYEALTNKPIKETVWQLTERSELPE